MQKIFLFTILTFLIACKGGVMPDVKKDPAKSEGRPDYLSLLQKKWQPTDVYPPDSSKRTEILATRIEFKSDGRVLVTRPAGDTSSTPYILSADGKLFLIKNDDKYEENIINELTASKLVFTTNDGQKLTLASK